MDPILEWSDERDKIVPAMFAAGQEISNPKKTRDGQTGNKQFYKFADMNDFLLAIDEAVKNHKLLLTQGIGGDASCVIVETQVTEVESCQWVRFRYSLATRDTTPKSQGSAITYGRKYGIQTVFNMYGEDDDGTNAGRGDPPGQRRGQGSAPPGSSPPGSGGSAPTNGNAATEKQIKAIFAIAKAENIEPQTVKEYMEQHYNVSSSSDLTGGRDGTASALIDALKSGDVFEWSSGRATDPTEEADVPY